MARIPSSSTAWSGNWNPKEDFGASGPGFVGEGKVKCSLTQIPQ